MKKVTGLTHLTFVLYVFASVFAYGSPKNFHTFYKEKAEKLKEKINSGGFSETAMAFTENKGQVCGYDGLPHPEVKFVFQQGSTQIFLLERGIAYQFTRVHYPEGYLELMKDKGRAPDFSDLETLQKQIRIETYRMDMTLSGARKNAVVTSEGKSADYTNFYNRSVLDVHSYSKITYHEVYPGIDWIIYCKDNCVKYDFVVHPGADVSLIKMQFDHQEGLVLNKDGSFTLKNVLGSVTEEKPLSFQNDKTIGTQFVLEDNTISFALTKFDGKQTLVIDPTLLWATYYGGSAADQGRSCTTDVSGNIYLAGFTESGSGIASAGHQNTFGGSTYDAFLVKFNSSGIRQWGTYYGGTNVDYGYSCAADASGNVYLAGYTQSTSGIASGGHQNTFGGAPFDAFLVKFNSSGIRQWCTYYGSTGYDYGYSCVTDVSDNVYLAGYTTSTSGIASGGHQNTFAGGLTDAFLVKFNSSGIRQWATYYGGTGSDEFDYCTADVSGNLYLAGYTSSTSGIATGGHQNTFGGNADAFLVKFNSSGIRQWGTYYGGAGAELCYSCATDASGNVYLAGNTQSTSGIASGGHQNVFGGAIYDAFLVKFNSSGIRQWGTYFGGTGVDYGYSCATDASDNVYLTGYTSSGSGIASVGFQNAFGGGSTDAFLVKFNNSGIRQWGTYYGSSGNDYGHSCVTYALGNVYLAGTTSSGSGIASGGHQNTLGGSNDAFLVKFCDVPSQPASIIGNTLVCVGSSQNYSVAIDLSTTSYSWNLPGINWTGTSTTNSISVTAGTSGIFSVSASNSCGTSATRTLNIVTNSLPTVAVNSGTICSGESFTIVPSGANTYSIQGGSTVVTPAASTNYTIVGVSAEGCISQNIATSNVTVNITPTVSVNSGSFCTGSAFTIIPSGANTYSIQGGVAVVAPLGNTSYTVRGLSAEGCISQNIATSNVSANITPTLSVNSGSICSGASFTIIPSGANTYTIQGGNAVVSPLSNAGYTVLGLSAEGCVSQNTATSNVTVNITPTVSVNSGSVCSGNSFTIIPSGANTYTIQGSNVIVTPLSNAGYTVLGLSAEGCVSQNTATSNVTVNITPTVSVNSGSVCSGNSFTIIPSGANTYTIQGSNVIVTPLSNAGYTVLGLSAEGCVSQNTATSNVTVNITPTVSVNSGSVCSGNSFTIIPSGATTYTIQGGNAVVSPLSNAGYTILGLSAEGCISQNIATSNVTVNITPTVSVNSGSICSGASFTIIPSGANTYTVQGGNAVVSPLSNAGYTVLGLSAEGCVSQNIATSNVTVNPTPTVSVNSGSICAGQVFTLLPQGAVNYTYPAGSVTVSPGATTSYTIKGSSAEGCRHEAVSVVTVNPLPQVQISGTLAVICVGESITLNVSGAVTYTWGDGSNGTSLAVSPTVTSTYSITGKDDNSCVHTVSATQIVDPCVGIEPLPIAETQFVVYPNPNSGEFFIETPHDVNIVILNALSQVILRQHLTGGKNKIDLSHEASGVYFVAHMSNGLMTRIKMIKQ